MSIFRTLRRLASRLRDGFYSTAFRVFDNLLPVRDDYWCFCSWSDYGHTLDNPRAVFEVLDTNTSVVRIVLLRSDVLPLATNSATARFVFCESIIGAYYLARSRVVLLGYAMPAIATYARYLRAPRHKVVFLGHGVTGLKRVGHFDGSGRDWNEETREYAATIASSQEESELMMKSFAPVPQCWITGLPRNDFILASNSALPDDYRAYRDSFDQRTRGRRVVLYAPTWRLNFSAPYIFSETEVAQLETLLARYGAILAIHGHPNADWRALFQQLPVSESIISVRDIPDINIILSGVDVLVTDYSSVFLDFLLLDRPIVHFAYDLDVHLQHNRFFRDPETIFAGPCAQSFSQLLEAIEVSLDRPESGQARRLELAQRFHEHSRNSAKQVVDRLFEMVHAVSGS